MTSDGQQFAAESLQHSPLSQAGELVDTVAATTPTETAMVLDTQIMILLSISAVALLMIGLAGAYYYLHRSDFFD